MLHDEEACIDAVDWGCSGPFTDARECPIHNPRLRVTRAQMEHAAAHPGEAWRAALAADLDRFTDDGGPPDT
jgi:hypothetical protein